MRPRLADRYTQHRIVKCPVLFFNAILLLAKNEKILKMANRRDRIISSNRRRDMDIMRLIPRNSYMEKIVNVIGTPDIKVITGV